MHWWDWSLKCVIFAKHKGQKSKTLSKSSIFVWQTWYIPVPKLLIHFLLLSLSYCLFLEYQQACIVAGSTKKGDSKMGVLSNDEVYGGSWSRSCNHNCKQNSSFQVRDRVKEISKWFAISSKIATNVDTKICRQQRKENTRVRFTSFSAPAW
jgi:hypothetical protein